MKKISEWIVIILMCVCFTTSAISTAEENTSQMIEIPYFSQYDTCSESEAEKDQYFSCFWASMLLRKGGDIDKYLEALDDMGLKYTRKNDILDSSTGKAKGVALWFAEDLLLAIYGNPVESAKINLYPNEPGIGAIIPVDLEENYIAMLTKGHKSE